MRPIYEFLGLTVGVIYPDMSHHEKQAAYNADITYGTNNEFGFDYLRDNMAFGPENKAQRILHFAIVDEVDSILIDEARTPLIISGAAEDSSELYVKINRIIPHLKQQAIPRNVEEKTEDGDYTVDEKQKQAHLTDGGHQHIEELLTQEGLLSPGESLYHANNIMLMHHVNAALKARAMFHRDVDYIVQNDQIVIVDEHTGRTMTGRRWSEGLHQAIEAKEGVSIQNENQTLASITFQNFFRIYEKLSGMTGTADTEAYEFQQIYNLEVVVIPTNKPMCRRDEADLIYLGHDDKFQAIIEDIRDCVARNQPVLVGTASIESSEFLSLLLNKVGIKHQVLNAKFHEKEAQIIAEAGRPGAVTIATNMAGRGTDIMLGGSLTADLQALGEDATEVQRQAIVQDWEQRHQAVLAAGGLRIIGSERHESRRIDNQLRGRAGRQGDPGSSRFYLSLEDNLMRIFASERVAMLMRRLGMKAGEPIEHSLVSKAIENAQRKLEGHHFDVRKQLLEYDNVANEQRKVIYSHRASVMAMTDLKDVVEAMMEDVMHQLVNQYVPPQSMEDQWDAAGLMKILADDFNLHTNILQWIETDHHIAPEQIKEKVIQCCLEQYAEKDSRLGRDILSQFEKSIILQNIDNQWREHLAAMDTLRQGIHLRGYAQKDPKQEYKREAFSLFANMLDSIKYDIVRMLLLVEVANEEDVNAMEAQRRAEQIQHVQYIHADETENSDAANNAEEGHTPFRRSDKKVGRNDPCPCGSDKNIKIAMDELGDKQMIKEAAVAMIIDEQNRLLLTQRALHLSLGGFWEFPGGKLESNETPEMALCREIKEEVGLDVLAFRYLGEVHHDYGTYQVILHGYIVHQFRGVAVCREAQTDLRWVHQDELTHFAFPEANQPLISRCLSAMCG
jgi:preprotein translocase subunit SecA